MHADEPRARAVRADTNRRPLRANVLAVVSLDAWPQRGDVGNALIRGLETHLDGAPVIAAEPVAHRGHTPWAPLAVRMLNVEVNDTDHIVVLRAMDPLILERDRFEPDGNSPLHVRLA